MSSSPHISSIFKSASAVVTSSVRPIRLILDSLKHIEAQELLDILPNTRYVSVCISSVSRLQRFSASPQPLPAINGGERLFLMGI